MSPKHSETENDFYRSSSSRISVRSRDARAASHDREPPPAAAPLEDRVLDLETDTDDVAFLRAQRRVPVRRGALPKKTANRLKQALVAAGVVAVLCGGGGALYGYATSSPVFRVQASDNIEISGVQSVPRLQVMDVFGGDIGRNIFFISLPERKQQLQEIPWVESAAVMRLLPNHLKVQVRERTPVAFVRVGPKAALIDAYGVLLDMPAKSAKKYSFPVIVGMEEAEPLSTRAARMKIFTNLMQQLDSTGARYSDDLS